MLFGVIADDRKYRERKLFALPSRAVERAYHEAHVMRRSPGLKDNLTLRFDEG